MRDVVTILATFQNHFHSHTAEYPLEKDASNPVDPSLNCSGKRISKRQYALIGGRPLHSKRNSLARHWRKRFLWDGDLAGSP